jgi:hypothetical protein
MVLSTFWAGGPTDFGTMEQWFGCFSLGGPEQWNNGFINFWGRGTGTMEQWFDQLLGPGDRNNGTMV